MQSLPASRGVMDRVRNFELLYASHAAAVKAYALRRADPWLADDVVSDVFLVCWRRMEDVPEEPLPWMIGVARRALSTRRRSEDRRKALSDRVAFETPAVTSQISHDDGTLLEAMRSLSDDDRELLLLTAWEGLSPRQAAIATGAKAPTVRVRLLRARRRLAAALAATDPRGDTATSTAPAPRTSEVSQ